MLIQNGSEINILFYATLFAAIFIIIAIQLRAKRNLQHITRRFDEVEQRISGRFDRIESELNRGFSERTQELSNCIALTSLGVRTPLFLGDWAIDSFTARFLVNELSACPPNCIVELGGGTSTALIAHFLKKLGHSPTHHIAVDHDAQYADLTKNLLKRAGVDDLVEILVCPLRSPQDGSVPWYSNLTDRLPDVPIDLLIVDGPPGNGGPLARLPALPKLLDRLSERAVILVDDANREDEQEICRQWMELVPNSEIEYSSNGHGLSVIRLKK